MDDVSCAIGSKYRMKSIGHINSIFTFAVNEGKTRTRVQKVELWSTNWWYYRSYII